MPADFDQSGCKYSYGAIVGGEGLVKLGHMAAKGRRLVHQIDLKTRSGQIKGSLDPANPSADNHYIAKTAALETFAHPIGETFANLFLNSI